MSASFAVTRPLDCRGLDGDQRLQSVSAVFDALRPGEALAAAFDSPPNAVLEWLRAERTGLFEWSPLAEGEHLWRVEIVRRRGGGTRNVSEALAWDHDRLDDLERRSFELRSSGRQREARDTYAVFAHGLRRHIRFEEELLFPEFERRAGLSPAAGPTAVMRAEHRELLGLLDAIEASIGEPSTNAERHREAFREVLGAHNAKEEQVLYPGVDRLLGVAEADALVARIQAL